MDNTDSDYYGLLYEDFPEHIGSLVKEGTGTLTLWNQNTYHGLTTVSNGTLQINGSIEFSSNVVVKAGGRLAGKGTIMSPVAVESGGTVTPGYNNTGTLYLGCDLTMDAGSTLAINLAGVGTNNALNVLGNVTLDGTISVTETGGFQPRGGMQWTIMTTTNGVSGSFTNRMANYGVTMSGNNLILARRVGGTVIFLQ